MDSGGGAAQGLAFDRALDEGAPLAAENRRAPRTPLAVTALENPLLAAPPVARAPTVPPASTRHDARPTSPFASTQRSPCRDPPRVWICH